MGEKKLLLEILLRPAMTQPSGMRVYEDGLYRYIKGTEDWYDVWTFTPEEMTELRQAITAADIPSLDSQYEAKMLVSDGTITIWRITFEGQQYQITLAPGAKIPALEKLFHTFSTLRKLSPEHSNWHVWQPDGSYRDFTVIGSVNAVEVLRSLVLALFVAPATKSETLLAVPPETLLIKTDWVTEEQTEQTTLYADGRYTREVGGECQEDKELPVEQVLNVMHAIQGTDWSSVPDRINTT